MKIIEKADEMRKISAELRDSGKKTGFVPTMGFLHRGHTSLFDKAAEISDIIIASIYVNPTQFGPNEDFEHYPRDRERDIELSEKHGVDILFAPDNKQMYPAGHSTTINVTRVSEPFEGEKRPGHFNGVATIVAKLFNIVNPDIAVFGQKDFQQTLVIKQMAADLNMGIKIVIAPTVRENDGLAMSSRNKYLSNEERLA
ncbi:MAG: pantoate--beta-alanine ligase, partial [Candidatus Kapaibacterium sp.]